MRITVHAGHAAPGHLYIGAVGFCSESVVDREITKYVIRDLRAAGHEVSDCTVDSGLSQSNIITKIKKNINAFKDADVNVSIHLNALNKKTVKDGKTTGVECCVYDAKKPSAASLICLNIANLGFKNRGIKQRTDLGVLKGITNGGDNILIECFFCNDEDDFNVYRKVGGEAIAKAISKALMDYYKPAAATPTTGNYIYKSIKYDPVFSPEYYAIQNPDIRKVYGNDGQKLFSHFITYGMKEGRKASPDFNVQVYKERYPDLKAAFGTNLPKYYEHYCVYGIKEGRKGI